jgi:putative ABC transport system substrate-binding protein
MANYSSDPVAEGIVTSLARPGGNVTGLIPFSPELSGKRLELFKETLPRLSRLAVMYSGARSQWHETQTVAKVVGLQLLSLEIRTAAELNKAFEGATQARVEALVCCAIP